MRFVRRGLMRLIIRNPLLLIPVLVLLAIIAVLWYRNQVQETNDAKKRRSAERRAHDSIFRDLD